MARKTQIEKAIAQIDGEIAILIAARERLRQQQAKAPVRRPKMNTGTDLMPSVYDRDTLEQPA